MRITGGQFRGRRLDTPKNNAIRPTSDKVRQAVFNMLNARGVVRGANVFDGFCGTGALGLEALSHGAEQACFFDKDLRSLDLAKINANILGVLDQCVFQKYDSTKLSLRPQRYEPFNLVFLDPPYNKNYVSLCANSLVNGEWLADDAILVIETEKGFDLSVLDMEIDKMSMYGDIQIAICRR